MIAKPIIVLPFKIETPSFARLMVEAPEELFLTDSKYMLPLCPAKVVTSRTQEFTGEPNFSQFINFVTFLKKQNTQLLALR